MNPEIDKLFSNAKRWRDEANKLREILLACGLTETRKWGQPCYTHDGKNICIIQRMNDFLALMFFKGGLLKDPDKVLAPQGPNSRSGYRICFTSVGEVTRLAGSIRKCVREAIAVEKAGLKIESAPEPDYPQELLDSFARDPKFRQAFSALTPGRQRGYVLHIGDAKKSSTRVARIEKHREKILAGKGLHDR